MRKCKVCQSAVHGRIDKIFCTVRCKSTYHRRLRALTKQASLPIDRILHRNRSILFEVLGKNKVQVKVSRLELDKKRFMYEYHTHQQGNSKGKTYHYIYDFAWMAFSSNEVLIINTGIKKAPTMTKIRAGAKT